MSIEELKRRAKALEGKAKRPCISAVVYSQEEYNQLRAKYPNHDLIIITWEDIVGEDGEPLPGVRVWS